MARRWAPPSRRLPLVLRRGLARRIYLRISSVTRSRPAPPSGLAPPHAPAARSSPRPPPGSCPPLGSLSTVPVPVRPRPGCESRPGEAVCRPSAALLRSRLPRHTHLRSLSSSAMTPPAQAPPHSWRLAPQATACRPQPM
eukprot:scaffold75499_cov59-Phaeocystis_antarctica.AAC.2